MNGRRDFVVFGIAGAAQILSGCAGPERGGERYQTDTETVTSVLISADGAHIVFIGRWHYVFDAPRALVAAINSPYHAALTATIGQAEVNRERQVSVPYELTLKSPTTAQEQAAYTDGFKAVTQEGRTVLILVGTLQGRCFTPNGAQLPVQSVGLNRTYTVTVRRETRGFESQGLPSPIRAVGTAGLEILAVPLMILTLPLVIVATPFMGSLGGVGRGP